MTEFSCAVDARERSLCWASVTRGAPGAAGFAALRSDVGQLAASEPEERLTEATRQPVAHANGSCGGETGMSTQHTEQSQQHYGMVAF